MKSFLEITKLSFDFKAAFEAAGFSVNIELTESERYNLFVSNELYIGCFSSNIYGEFAGALFTRDGYNAIADILNSEEERQRKNFPDNPMIGYIWYNLLSEVGRDGCVMANHDFSISEIKGNIERIHH